jgi:hypothetical protein
MQMKKVILSLMMVLLCLSFSIADTDVPNGKRSHPGKMPPGYVSTDNIVAGSQFTFKRDPFQQPTEILPTKCPPSMPLCRLDYSQLKVVSIMQVSDGPLKAFVEDPDGRGYAVATGQMIGQATVTQISSGGIYLKVHKTRKDVVLPLYREDTEKES